MMILWVQEGLLWTESLPMPPSPCAWFTKTARRPTSKVNSQPSALPRLCPTPNLSAPHRHPSLPRRPNHATRHRHQSIDNGACTA